MSEQQQPGQEVRSDDPGVPNDPPGPDVPQDTGPSLSPDVPVGPQVTQPEGTADVDGADPHRGDAEPDADDETSTPPGAGGDGSTPQEHDHPD